MRRESIEVTIDETVYTVTIERSARKTLRLSLSETGDLQVKAPYGVEVNFIRAFIIAKGNWLAKQFRANEEKIPLVAFSEAEEKRAREKLRQEAAVFFYESLAAFEPKPSKIRVGAQKTRWGSCSGNGTISLNVYLTQLPGPLREYVYLHEFCHLTHPNHQAGFWAELAKFCPDYQARRKELKRYRLPSAAN